MQSWIVQSCRCLFITENNFFLCLMCVGVLQETNSQCDNSAFYFWTHNVPFCTSLGSYGCWNNNDHVYISCNRSRTVKNCRWWKTRIPILHFSLCPIFFLFDPAWIINVGLVSKKVSKEKNKHNTITEISLYEWNIFSIQNME